MSTPIENVKIGDYITLIEDRQAPRSWRGPLPLNWLGLPWRVLSISSPFVAAEYKGELCAIDMRRYGVQVLSRHYAKAMLGQKTVKAKKKRNPRICPQCGGPLRIILTNHKWLPTCTACSLQLKE